MRPVRGASGGSVTGSGAVTSTNSLTCTSFETSCKASYIRFDKRPLLKQLRMEDGFTPTIAAKRSIPIPARFSNSLAATPAGLINPLLGKNALDASIIFNYH